jgi:hypothetical protein
MKGVQRCPGKVRLSNSRNSLAAGDSVGIGVGGEGGLVQADRKRVSKIRRVAFIL